MAKRIIWFTNSVVNIFILIVILLLLAFGSYTIWDSNQVYHAADSARYANYKPTDAGSLSFQDLQAINPEVIAWLTVYGTHIDYPVNQSPNDNLKYINTDAKGNYSLSGAIFLDYRNSPDFSDFNSIIYGHHMDKNTMFGEIGLFAQKDYFDARAYGSLFYNGTTYGLEFFAFVPADAYDDTVYNPNIQGQAAQQAYLNMLLQKATNVRSSVTVGPSDRILLLSTCSEDETNGRDILIAKITDQTYDDTFANANAAPANPIQAVTQLPGLWARAALPVKILIAALPSLLILLIIFLVWRRRRRVKERAKSASEPDDEIDASG